MIKIQPDPNAEYGNHDGLRDDDEMKVERDENMIKVYGDMDEMLPLISIGLDVARKLYSDIGSALEKPIKCCDNPKLSYVMTRDKWICTNCKANWRN